MNVGSAESRLKNLEKRLLPNNEEDELKNYFKELESKFLEEKEEQEHEQNRD